MKCIVAILCIVMTRAGFAMGAIDSISLPLQGYCHVGRFMPARAQHTSEVRGQGILPVICADGFGDAVVPVMVVSESASIAGAGPLAVSGTDQKLIGIAGSASADDAKRIFGDAIVVPIEIPLRGPPMAWETLDGIVIAGRDLPDEATIGTLLAAGVTLTVKSQSRPSSNWPWQKRDDGWWMLKYEPLGPRENSPDASNFLAAWSPGVPASDRRNAVVLGVIFAILALAASLRRGTSAIWTLGIVAIGSVLAIGLWINGRSASRAAGGAIEVVNPPLRQIDIWTLRSAKRAATLSSRISGLTWPMIDTAQIAKTNLTLECDRDGHPIHFRWDAQSHEKIAFLSRRVEVSDAPIKLTAHRQSPLRQIVADAYQNATILGEADDGAMDNNCPSQRWPTVFIKP